TQPPLPPAPPLFPYTTLFRSRSAANGAVRQPKRVAKNPYINRELSWLDYAGRVLFEARDARNRLLDRVNFLTIFASMLDEFFQRSEEHTSELQSRFDLVCRLL